MATQAEHQDRSPSPSASAAQRALRQQLRFLRELTEFEDAALLHRRPRRQLEGAPPPSLPTFRQVPPVLRPHVNSVMERLRDYDGSALLWHMEDAARREPLPPGRVQYQVPPPCAFLRPGQSFAGWQRVAHFLPGKGEQWAVAVTLQGYEAGTGRMCGSMTATSVPQATKPVVTFFEGQVIDNVNSSFYTTDWGAVADTDLRHWSRFAAFTPMRREVTRHGGRAPGLAASGTIFMRWKEQFFVEGGECRLTIAGFYYVALDRTTGAIEAFYYDPASSPDQKVFLEACGGHAGHSFPAHDVA